MNDWLPQRTWIVAELSANHNQSLNRAKETIKAIADTGADAVKIQTYKPESLCLNLNNEYFGKIKSGIWQGSTLWDLYQQAALPYSWHKELQHLAHQLGLAFFSSPFDEEGVDFLQTLAMPYYKIASFEINHIPLIQKVASTGKPIIISTGIADIEDIQLALDTCYAAGNHQVALLKCTSQYPATIEQANLATITDMQQRFGVPIGLSDHTLGPLVATIAVSLGARLVEKHFTLNRADGGPDSTFSMEPDEFAAMITQIRQVESSLGKAHYQISAADKMRQRSIFFCRNLAAGKQLQPGDIRILRNGNGNGIHPKDFYSLFGLTLKRKVKIGEPVTLECVDKPS